MKNRSVVFSGKNQVEIIDRELEPLKAGEMLVKTRQSMISIGTELTILTQENLDKDCFWMEYGAYPYYPGYNNIGEIVEVADEKDKHLVGKMISSYLPHAEYGVVSGESEYRLLLDGIATDEAVFATFAEIILQGIRRGRSTWGESAIVYGAGLLGQLTADFLRIAGVCPVIVCDTSDARLNMLTKSPMIIPVNPTRQDVKEVVKEATRGRMADAVYELTGVASLIPQEMELLHDMGRMVILSSPRGKTTMDFHDYVNRPSCEIIGAHNLSHPEVATLQNPWSFDRDAEIFMQAVINKQLDVKRLITHREHFTKAVDMYEMLIKDRSKTMGVLFDWDK